MPHRRLARRALRVPRRPTPQCSQELAAKGQRHAQPAEMVALARTARKVCRVPVEWATARYRQPQGGWAWSAATAAKECLVRAAAAAAARKAKRCALARAVALAALAVAG